MELKLNSGDTITIPDGCKAVIKDKIITFEKEVKEFEYGDFCTVITPHGNWTFIYKSKKDNDRAYHYALLVDGLRLPLYDNFCVASKDKTRASTEEEKQSLLDALHADGKDWDADKKQIVDYRWKPKEDETYYYIDSFLDVCSSYWDVDSADNLAYSRGNCFKTEEEAHKYADKFSEILKERKL